MAISISVSSVVASRRRSLSVSSVVASRRRCRRRCQSSSVVVGVVDRCLAQWSSSVLSVQLIPARRLKKRVTLPKKRVKTG